ncbi:hypothetical protein [Lactobacillus mulieris]|uniref:hypothetical protein n=1 Tax=Lactobacillus mulieris TaxID=2508708 RepID=UPI001F099930|nr:hypothetical protein [Lactobacillus mulieris]
MKNNLFRRNTAMVLTSLVLSAGVVTAMPKQALAESNESATIQKNKEQAWLIIKG